MAFGRLERTTGPQPMSDINMTPLIDVMLVLLVIFMITAPLLTTSLKLNLPQSEAATPDTAQQSLTVTLTATGELQLDDEKLADAAFVERMGAVARRNPEAEVQLRADKTVPYGQVAELIGLVQKAGLFRIAFVAEPVAPASPAEAASR
jgi:biopolymer transport protein ExbD/biopolymer transport protein TolR